MRFRNRHFERVFSLDLCMLNSLFFKFHKNESFDRERRIFVD